MYFCLCWPFRGCAWVRILSNCTMVMLWGLCRFFYWMSEGFAGHWVKFIPQIRPSLTQNMKMTNQKRKRQLVPFQHTLQVRHAAGVARLTSLTALKRSFLFQGGDSENAGAMFNKEAHNVCSVIGSSTVERGPE